VRWNSLRVRLTLWHVAVLGLVLTGFSFALCYSVRHSLAATVDRELTERAHGYTSRWEASRRFRSFRGFERGPGEPRRGPEPGFMPRPDGPGDGPRGPEPGFQPPPGFGAGAAPGQYPGLPPAPQAIPVPPATGAAGQPTGSEVERRGFYRRPRALNLEGGPFFPLAEDTPWDWDAFLVSSGGGKDAFAITAFETDRLRVFSTPLRENGEVIGVIQVAHPLTEQDQLNTRLLNTLLMLVPLALLVAGVGGIFLTDRALRPVRSITQAAAEISETEDLSRRLEVTGKDELAELAATFNTMIERLDEAFHRLESAYDQQRRFAADASHELRTPLTAIKANTSLALTGEPSVESYREALTAADHAADSMTRIVQDLLLLARSDTGQLVMEAETVEMEPLLRKAVRALPARTTAVELRLEAGLAARGDSHHLGRLFLNLLENAVRHTPPDGLIRVSAWPDGERVIAQVADTGEGIAPEHLPHVTERFYRVDSARSRARGGTGLGLAICESIAQAHGGSLSVTSEVGVGTTVTVTLPRAAAEPPAALPEPPREFAAAR